MTVLAIVGDGRPLCVRLLATSSALPLCDALAVFVKVQEVPRTGTLVRPGRTGYNGQKEMK